MDLGSGPIDVLVLGFDGIRFDGIGFDRGTTTALRDLAARGIVRVLDVLFVYKDADGVLDVVGSGELGHELTEVFDLSGGQRAVGLLDADDVEEVGRGLRPDSSVVVLALENTWVVPLVEAVRGSGGDVVDHARVPAEVVATVRRGVAGWE